MEQPANSLRGDAINFLRGFCMGAADIVPGVSGGTVALVLGHYQRLVTAISRIDGTALRMLRAGRIGDAWTHIDGRFLVVLGGGVATGIVGLASLMHGLLEHQHAETLAVFFGLVLASGLVVAGMIGRWTTATGMAALLGTALAWVIASLSPTAADPTYPYLFFSACIAICAMILPGISGSFVLLLLGAYYPVTGMIRGLSHGEISLDILLRLSVFAAGCGIGLGLFSRLLRTLLQRYADITFAALLGLMLGSLKMLWPLQIPTAQTAALEFQHRVWVPVWPQQWPTSVWPLVALAALAAALVLLLNYFGSQLAANLPTPEVPTPEVPTPRAPVTGPPPARTSSSFQEE